MRVGRAHQRTRSQADSRIRVTVGSAAGRRVSLGPGFGIRAVLEHHLVGVIAGTRSAPGPAPPHGRRQHLIHHCAASPSRANLAGGWPTVLVKAVLNELAEL